MHADTTPRLLDEQLDISRRLPVPFDNVRARDGLRRSFSILSSRNCWASACRRRKGGCPLPCCRLSRPYLKPGPCRPPAEFVGRRVRKNWPHSWTRGWFAITKTENVHVLPDWSALHVAGRRQPSWQDFERRVGHTRGLNDFGKSVIRE